MPKKLSKNEEKPWVNLLQSHFSTDSVNLKSDFRVPELSQIIIPKIFLKTHIPQSNKIQFFMNWKSTHDDFFDYFSLAIFHW